MTPDLINGIFEVVCGLFSAINCFSLYRDKAVAGVSLVPTMFYTAWGLWALVYYPLLHQWMSFGGGIGVVLANATWVVMAIYYKTKASA